jgi:sulfocyanin
MPAAPFAEKPTPSQEENHLPRASLAGLLLVALAGPGRAEERLVPSWMTVDAATDKVEMDVVAGFNSANSSWNFNGYHDGNMTVVVPESWSVRIDFTSRDAEVPHSLVVMADPGKDNLPMQAGREQVAFSRAYSKSPEQGISPGDKDVISFKAKTAGDYLWYCGVMGHGQSGMWVYFKVSAGLDAPYVTLAEGAEDGRQ